MGLAVAFGVWHDTPFQTSNIRGQIDGCIRECRRRQSGVVDDGGNEIGPFSFLGGRMARSASTVCTAFSVLVLEEVVNVLVLVTTFNGVLLTFVAMSAIVNNVGVDQIGLPHFRGLKPFEIARRLLVSLNNLFSFLLGPPEAGLGDKVFARV